MITLLFLGLISLNILNLKYRTNHAIEIHDQSSFCSDHAVKLFLTEKNNLVLSKRASTISLSCIDGRVQVSKHMSGSLPKQKPQIYDAVHGIFDLPLGSYVVLVKSSKFVEDSLPSLEGIRMATDYELINIPGNDRIAKASIEELQHHRSLRNQLISQLKKHNFYFSTNNYDVTKSFQQNTFKEKNPRHFDRNTRFFWNFNQIKSLVNVNATDLITPMCSGWIRSCNFSTSDESLLKVSLIARRARNMQGTRYADR
jgi:hypothetical protein